MYRPFSVDRGTRSHKERCDAAEFSLGGQTCRAGSRNTESAMNREGKLRRRKAFLGNRDHAFQGCLAGTVEEEGMT